jgi:hypothetical protein
MVKSGRAVAALDPAEGPNRTRADEVASCLHRPRPATAHVIVLGNEKGGSGKSTLAMHVAAALMDEFRRDWAKRKGLELKIPTHACIARGATALIADNAAIEATEFADAIFAIEHTHDFVVVDMAGATRSDTEEVVHLQRVRLRRKPRLPRLGAPAPGLIERKLQAINQPQDPPLHVERNPAKRAAKHSRADRGR